MQTPRKFSLGVVFDNAMLVFTLAMVWGAVAAVPLALVLSR
jgi:hypothetical protein